MTTALLQADVPISALSAGNTAFGLSLFAQLRQSDGNLFMSPFSVSCALAMTAAGALGETRAEMRHVLNLPTNGDSETDAVFGRLLTELERHADKPGATLRVANSLWPQQGETLREGFRRTVETQFHAGIAALDYRRDPEAARLAINAWVAERTEHRIPDLLGEGALTPLTRMVLANAIYFKGDWALPFDPDLTREAPFYLAPERSTPTPTMFREDRFGYTENNQAQCIELRYAGGETAMTILLPHTSADRQTLEAELTPERIDAWQAALTPQTVRLFLPRFRIDARFELNAALKALGMRRAFSPGTADFSGMREAGNDLHIDTVMHQAVVEVDEKGTVAAAATAVVMRVTSLPPPAPEFRADRPFLFWIRHVPTDTLLFLGRLETPR